MSITASLEVHSLPEILQFMGLSGSSGFMTVTGESDVAGIALRNGRVLYARTGSSARLGEALVNEGFLTEKNLEAVLIVQRMKKVKQALGTILLELGLASKAELEEQVARQCKRVLADVLTWTKGSYRFEPLAVDDTEMLLADGIEIATFLLGAVCPQESELELVA